MGRYNVVDFTFDGRYHDYAWEPKYNPNATIANGLANCTTMAIVFSYINKVPYPVSRIVSAASWEKVLINGWKAVPYGSCQLKVGDIIQWKANCHVATVIGISEGEAVLGCSWYTGEHGKSTYDGRYDTRSSIHSLEQLSDVMYTKYPFRMYHECSLYEEAQRVGGMPENVLVAPIFEPDGESPSVPQIHVLTDEQNVRDADGNIIGVARKGFYNVYGYKDEDGYRWYQIREKSFIAGVEGRVKFIPVDSDVEALKAENRMLKEKLRKIQEEAQF